MATGEQRPSRCLSIRRDHTHHERFKALFFYYYGQCEQYIYMGFVLFSEKQPTLILRKLKQCAYILVHGPSFFFSFFFLKIISHWSLFHPIFLYLCLEPHHPIHLVRPYGRLTLYLKLLKRLLRFYVLKSWVDSGVCTLSQILTLNPP